MVRPKLRGRLISKFKWREGVWGPFLSLHCSSLQGGFFVRKHLVLLTLTISKNFPEFLGNSLTLKIFHFSLAHDCYGKGKDFPHRGGNPGTAFN